MAAPDLGRSGKGFEVDRVAPDVEVVYSKALKKAHALAREEATHFRRYREEQANNDIDFDEDEEAAQAFEKIQVQVTFPQLSDLLENKITLERWIPWEQVYGVDEDLEAGTSEDSPDGESFSPPDGESE